MRTLILIAFLSFACLNIKSQSYEIKNGDTLNLIDAAGKKQGKWIYMGIHKPGTCHKLDQKVEEGEYKDHKKTGIWLEYFCNGNIKNKLTFVNGRPEGPAIIYRNNGTVLEKGEWKTNRWVGNHKFFHENGKVDEYTIGEDGKTIDKKTYKEAPQKPIYSDPTK